MDSEIRRLCDFVRETAFQVHCYLKNGHLEKIYENALANRLRKAGLTAVQQHPLNVFDEDGTPLGIFAADLFVEGILLVELKAARAISDAHTAQLLGYLRAARLEHGMLCNFGAPIFQVRKYALSKALGSPSF